VDNRLQNVVGEELNEAEATAIACGYILREVTKDGIDLAVTCEFDPLRINVATENGVVVSICSIG